MVVKTRYVNRNEGYARIMFRKGNAGAEMVGGETKVERIRGMKRGVEE